ncbi:phosphoribosyl-AMP cyclohydrolase [Exiguobacterium sp. K1]|nr:phosphoribosyl-AMP cyclohydrolase [Exiguobacterium sp. K1]MDX1259243.1 phosphoribosyl-AMP cyclohydrolase [Exiguobacterium sp. K1]
MIELNFSKGLVAAVILDETTNDVLMVGFMDQAAYDKTLETGLVTFFSRTKNRLWTKGETSGHTLELRRMWIDCDQDSLLITVKANGPTCHTGNRTCFYTEVEVPHAT